MIQVIGFWEYPDPFRFIAKHTGHQLEIRSEYGDIYDWQASQIITRGAASGQADAPAGEASGQAGKRTP